MCRAKLLCKPSVDSHPHAGNSLETIPTRCFLLWNIPGQRVTKVSQCSDSYWVLGLRFQKVISNSHLTFFFFFFKTSSSSLENEKLSGGALEFRELSQFAQSWDRKWGGKTVELGGAGAAGSLPWKLQIPSLSALGTLDKQPYRPPTLLQWVKGLRNVNHSGVKCDPNLHLIKAN